MTSLTKRPGWLLAAIVAVSFVVWGAAATLSKSPWIFADELIYAELARSIASGSSPALRGVPTSHGFGLVYSTLIAPAWRLSSSVTTYRLIHAINALALSLTAVPAYLLARRFVSQRGALTVAAFTVLVPSMTYAGAVLTEVAFYPLFVLAVAALARAIDTASTRDQLLTFVVIALATAAKVLAVALVGAMVLAILLLALLARIHDSTPIRASLGRYRATFVAVVGGAAVLVSLSLVRGQSPYEWLGAYGDAVRRVRLVDIPLELLQHLAALSLYTAVVPVAAAAVVVLIGFGKSPPERLRVFTVVLLSTVVCTTFGVAVFAAHASHIDFETTGTPAANPLYERNLFVVCPLLLLALAVWIELGLPRPRIAAPLIAAASALLMLVYPWSKIPNASNPQNLAPVMLRVLPISPWLIATIALAIATIAALAFLYARRERPAVLWAVVGFWFVLVGIVAVAVFAGASRYVVRTSAGVPVDWVDRAVGKDATVTVLWNEAGTTAYARPGERQRKVWLAEFFNRSIEEVYVIGPALPFGLPQTRVVVRPNGRVTSADGSAMTASYVLARCALGVDAPLVAHDAKTRMGLYRVDGAVVVRASAAGCPRG